MAHRKLLKLFIASCACVQCLPVTCYVFMLGAGHPVLKRFLE